MSILQSFAFIGIKNLLVEDRETGALVADIEHLTGIKIDDSQTVDFMRGGYENPKLMAFYGDRDSKFTATNASMSMDLLKVITGGDTILKTTDVQQVEILKVATNKVTLEKAPKTGTLKVYALDQFGKKSEPLVLIETGNPAAGEYTITGAELGFADEMNGKNVKVYYKVEEQVESIEAKSIIPKTYRMTGLLVAKEIETGKIYLTDLYIPNASVQPSFTLGAENSGTVPEAVELSIDMLQDQVLGYPYEIKFRK